MDPPVFLSAGDVICAGVEGLGEQEQKVVPWRDTSAGRGSPDYATGFDIPR